MKKCYSACPNCGEQAKIDWGDINIDGEQAWQKCHCSECETDVIEGYEYIGTEIT